MSHFSSASSAVGIRSSIGSRLARIYSADRRSSRRTFALEVMIWAVCGAALEIFFECVIALQEAADPEGVFNSFVDSVVSAASYAWLLALFFIAARRCRDCGFSAAAAYVLLVPAANFLFLLLLFVFPGRPDPKLKALLEESQRLREEAGP